jgi:hypothetical protein
MIDATDYRNQAAACRSQKHQDPSYGFRPLRAPPSPLGALRQAAPRQSAAQSGCVARVRTPVVDSLNRTALVFSKEIEML